MSASITCTDYGFWLQQYEWPKTILFLCLSPPPSFFYWKENIFWMLRYFFFLKGIFIHYLRISHVLIVYFDHICPHYASFQLLPDLPSTPPNIIHPFFKICIFSLEFHYSIVFTLFQVLPLPPPIPPMLPFPSTMQLLHVPLRKQCRWGGRKILKSLRTRTPATR